MAGEACAGNLESQRTGLVLLDLSSFPKPVTDPPKFAIYETSFFERKQELDVRLNNVHHRGLSSRVTDTSVTPSCKELLFIAASKWIPTLVTTVAAAPSSADHETKLGHYTTGPSSEKDSRNISEFTRIASP